MKIELDKKHKSIFLYNGNPVPRGGDFQYSAVAELLDLYKYKGQENYIIDINPSFRTIEYFNRAVNFLYSLGENYDSIR